MLAIQPYLNFPGNTEEAFRFYQSVFGWEFSGLQRFGETPDAGNIRPENIDKIMHIALPVGKTTVLMATDAVESMGQKLVVGNNVSLTIIAESKEEADRLFKGLSEWGNIEMPIADAFWGAYFGMLKDRFGIQWMVNYDYPKP